jgi:hypothetical protein
VRVLPKLHAVDRRIQRHFVTADVDEIVVAANHAWGCSHNRVREVRTLRQREFSQPFGGEMRRPRREHRGDRVHCDLHGFLNAPQVQRYIERLHLPRLQ